MIIWIPPHAITIITSPGIIIHEIAHRFFCDIFNVRVLKVRYLSFSSEASGYVIHEKNEKFYIDLLIGIAPFFVNSLICMFLTFPHVVSTIYTLGNNFNYATSSIYYTASLALYTLGIIIGICAFPSKKDLVSPKELANTWFQKCLIAVIRALNWPFNISMLGLFLKIYFAMILSYKLPYLFYRIALQ
ncbi:MAG: hypothetical protein ACOYT8_04945 [Candidatus Dependentiae bacterium]